MTVNEIVKLSSELLDTVQLLRSQYKNLSEVINQLSMEDTDKLRANSAFITNTVAYDELIDRIVSQKEF